jgi:hypothetical protein
MAYPNLGWAGAATTVGGGLQNLGQLIMERALQRRRDELSERELGLREQQLGQSAEQFAAEQAQQRERLDFERGPGMVAGMAQRGFLPTPATGIPAGAGPAFDVGEQSFYDTAPIQAAATQRRELELTGARNAPEYARISAQQQEIQRERAEREIQGAVYGRMGTGEDPATMMREAERQFLGPIGRTPAGISPNERRGIMGRAIQDINYRGALTERAQRGQPQSPEQGPERALRNAEVLSKLGGPDEYLDTVKDQDLAERGSPALIAAFRYLRESPLPPDQAAQRFLMYEMKRFPPDVQRLVRGYFKPYLSAATTRRDTTGRH